MIPIHRIFFKLSSSNQYRKRNLPISSVCCHRFSNSSSSFKKNYDSIGIFFFSSISCVALGLGCWQLQRYQQKLLKVLDSKNSLHQSQIDIPSLTQMELNRFLSGLVNRKVCLGYGEYQHHLETLLGPRSSPVGRSAQGMASNPQVR
jgi:cytochrome oxidase assembly protein ShyY1